MEASHSLLRHVASCVLDHLAIGVLDEVLADTAEKVATQWAEDKDEESRREELAAVARLDMEEAEPIFEQIATRVAENRSDDTRRGVVSYLAQVPPLVRQHLRRVSDPSGRTVPSGMDLSKPESMMPFLAPRISVFRPGARPLEGVDWELVELLGLGGFGEVWKAKNPHFDGVPPVALKFCLDPEAKDRMLGHEAAVLNQVMRQGRHPGIVQLQHTYLSADPPCLEYEYVEGGDLAGLIQEWTRLQHELPPRKIARVLLKIADIVAYAHLLQPPIVHRDLKPANIMVVRGEDGSLIFKIVDFGIGGLDRNQAFSETSSRGRFMNTLVRGSHTPLYASPEQMVGDPPDPRDDVHALGVVWCQMLTGDLARGVPKGRRFSQRLAERGMTDEQIDLLESCYSDSLEDRPANAGVLAEEIRRVYGDDLETEEDSEAVLEAVEAEPVDSSIVVAPEGPYEEPELSEEESNDLSTVRRNPESIMMMSMMRQIREEAIALRSGTVHSGHDEEEDEPEPIDIVAIRLEPGDFLMGSSEDCRFGRLDQRPRRRVRISRPFELAALPITQFDFQRVMGVNPSRFQEDEEAEEFPVECVSWYEAIEFCNRLSQRNGLSAFYDMQPGSNGNGLDVAIVGGDGYRLPTEAEWEYACRAGSEGAFFFGDDPSRLDEFAWFRENSMDGPRPVGRKEPNIVGLYDMIGNVWEWCWDWYDGGYPEGDAEDPVGPDEGRYRVWRGGAFYLPAEMLGSAGRFWSTPGFGVPIGGIRVARSVE